MNTYTLFFLTSYENVLKIIHIQSYSYKDDTELKIKLWNRGVGQIAMQRDCRAKTQWNFHEPPMSGRNEIIRSNLSSGRRQLEINERRVV